MPGRRRPQWPDRSPKAQRALKRADDARAAGDEETAVLLEGLAREWAEMGKDVMRAAALEADAAALQVQAADAAVHAQRARTMLDELVARKARAEGELKALIEARWRAGGPSSSASPAKPLPKSGPKAPPPKPPKPAGKAPAKGGNP